MRWLNADALQPWRHRSWIFPRDPYFAEKAGRVLDLYAGWTIALDELLSAVGHFTILALLGAHQPSFRIQH
jgi:hypothetical protein